MLRDNQPRGYSQSWAMRTASKHTSVLQVDCKQRTFGLKCSP